MSALPMACIAGGCLVVGFLVGTYYEINQTFRKGGTFDKAYDLGRRHGYDNGWADRSHDLAWRR